MTNLQKARQTIRAAAEKYAIEILGAKQFKENRDAARSVMNDFFTGARWMAATLSQSPSWQEQITLLSEAAALNESITITRNITPA